MHTILCDICQTPYEGVIYFRDDMMLCRDCDKDLSPKPPPPAADRLRSVPAIAWGAIFLVSCGVAIGVDTMPLVDVVASITAMTAVLFGVTKAIEGRHR